MVDLPPLDPGIEIVVASRGISKGLAQTEGPQLVARGQLGLGAFYAGAQWKNISSPTADGEASAFAGARTAAAGFDLTLSAAYKRLTASPASADSEALETVAAVSRRIGPVTPRLSATWSPDDLGSTGRSLFVEAGAGYALPRGLGLSAALGRRSRDGGPDYTAWNAGFTKTLIPGVSADLRYYDTDLGRLGDPYRARVVLSFRGRF